MGEPSLPVRVAVATKTGARVDTHFARTARFDIFDVVDGAYSFVESRENPAADCGCGTSREGAVFERITALIADCRFVVAFRIGNGALSYLIDRGIRAAQADDTIDNALRFLIDNGKLKTLFRKHERTG